VVVGANFTFGHRAAGTAATLHGLGASHGFAAEALDTVLVDGRPVSSSSIRESLAAGDLDWPERALGRRYAVDGTVVSGAGRGRELGFPTANLRTPDGILLPGRGVYAGRAIVGDAGWPAAINIGVNPTFGREPLHLEAYLLGFEGDLTGSVLTVEFWARLRDEVRFDGPAELGRQIERDVQATRHLVGGETSPPVIP
jgi:riboflavin kinase/FMN adenylyltransferase